MMCLGKALTRRGAFGGQLATTACAKWPTAQPGEAARTLADVPATESGRP